MFVINRLGQLSWHKMGQNLKLLQPWWNFSTAKSRKKKKNHLWKLVIKQSKDLRLLSVLGTGSNRNMSLERRKGFRAPNTAASRCHLWGHRPWSAVSHLYFSPGAAVPAQTTYLANQSQLRQSLTAQIRGIEANYLVSREPSLIFWGGRLKFTTKFHPAVPTTSTPWCPKVKEEHQQSSDRHWHLIIESLGQSKWISQYQPWDSLLELLCSANALPLSSLTWMRTWYWGTCQV